MLEPTDCIAADWSTPWYERWSKLMDFGRIRHPKYWETAAIAQALEDRGELVAGKRGLGLGCGTEHLPSVFATLGVDVVATDQDPETDEAQHWDNGQLAHGLESVFHPEIVDRQTFLQHVTYKSYDMTAEEPSFDDAFDFVWHNCSIGHVGALELSMQSLERQAGYLHDGGWLVFTTELNIASLDETILGDFDTCIWRLSDLYALFERMDRIGMTADRLQLRLGADALDTSINYNLGIILQDRPKEDLQDPTVGELKIPIREFAATQILLCFRRTGREDPARLKEHRKDLKANTAALRAFARRTPDLRDYFEPPKDREVAKARLRPLTPAVSVTIPAGERGEVAVRFVNDSPFRAYDGVGPVPLRNRWFAVGTSGPQDRSSPFQDQSWANENRIVANMAVGESPAAHPTTWHGHRADSGQEFELRFRLTAPVTPGDYAERFALVFDHVAWVASSEFTVDVTVTDPIQAAAVSVVDSTKVSA